MRFLLDFASNLLNSIRVFWWAVRAEGEEGGVCWGSCDWDWEWEREETGRSRLLGGEEELVVGVETFRRLDGCRKSIRLLEAAILAQRSWREEGIPMVHGGKLSI